MTDCVKLIEKENLRKVVNREKRVKREETRRKERLGWESLPWLTPHFTDAYAYHCGLRVRVSPTPSEAIKLLFPTKKKLEIFLSDDT